MEVKGDPFALVFGQCTKLKVENSQPFPFTWKFVRDENFSIWEFENSQPRFVHLVFHSWGFPWIVQNWIQFLAGSYLSTICTALTYHSRIWDLRPQRFPPKDLRSSSQSCPLICFCNIKFSYLRIKHLHLFSTQGFEIKIAQFTTERFKIFISKFSTQGIELFLSFCPYLGIWNWDLKLSYLKVWFYNLIFSYLKDLNISY